MNILLLLLIGGICTLHAKYFLVETEFKDPSKYGHDGETSGKISLTDTIQTKSNCGDFTWDLEIILMKYYQASLHDN